MLHYFTAFCSRVTSSCKRKTFEECETWEDFVQFLGGLPEDLIRVKLIRETWDKHLNPNARQRWTDEDRQFWFASIWFWRDKWL